MIAHFLALQHPPVVPSTPEIIITDHSDIDSQPEDWVLVEDKPMMSVFGVDAPLLQPAEPTSIAEPHLETYAEMDNTEQEGFEVIPAIIPALTALPTTLLEVLANTLILHQTAPYLDVADRLALASTAKSYRSLLFDAPETFRHLSLVKCKRARIEGGHGPVDPGGISWRAERMDEALTEDEFYCGPIRGIMYNLSKKHILQNVSTMILDGLTIPADFVREVIAEDKYNVRILSIREAKHLNERKLMQVLKYACRDSRPEGTPRLKGLYVFGPMDPSSKPAEPEIGRRRSPTRYPDTPASSVMTALGAQLGADWNRRSQALLSTELEHKQDKWWQASGSMFKKDPMQEWAETVKTCEGIIHFDAVLCRGPQHTPTAKPGPEPDSRTYSWYPDSLATVALGPAGCAKCGKSPEGPAVFDRCGSTEIPLLAPPPLHSSTVREAQRPFSTGVVDGKEPCLIARCKHCLRGRWCERCHKWWCEDCYEIPSRGSSSSTSSLTQLQQTEMFQGVAQAAAGIDAPTSETKVYNGLCIDPCLMEELIHGSGEGGMWG